MFTVQLLVRFAIGVENTVSRLLIIEVQSKCCSTLSFKNILSRTHAILFLFTAGSGCGGSGGHIVLAR